MHLDLLREVARIVSAKHVLINGPFLQTMLVLAFRNATRPRVIISLALFFEQVIPYVDPARPRPPSPANLQRLVLPLTDLAVQALTHFYSDTFLVIILKTCSLFP